MFFYCHAFNTVFFANGQKFADKKPIKRSVKKLNISTTSVPVVAAYAFAVFVKPYTVIDCARPWLVCDYHCKDV